MGLAEFITIALNMAVFLKDYPLIISIILLLTQLTRNLQYCKAAAFFRIKSFKKNINFDPNTLYTKRPVIEFSPICFVQKQENVELFVKSIQDFVDSKIIDRVHLITYNFVPLTNIDIYFIRSIEKLLNNAIYDNNGLLVTFIFQDNPDNQSLIYEMQSKIQTDVGDAITQKRIQTNTITIKIDQRDNKGTR